MTDVAPIQQASIHSRIHQNLPDFDRQLQSSREVVQRVHSLGEDTDALTASVYDQTVHTPILRCYMTQLNPSAERTHTNHIPPLERTRYSGSASKGRRSSRKSNPACLQVPGCFATTSPYCLGGPFVRVHSSLPRIGAPNCRGPRAAAPS